MNTRIGIDRRGDLCYVARVDYQTGRAEVKALARFQPEHLKDHHLLSEGDRVIAIPDDKAIVKQVFAPSSESSDGPTRARFELLQGLLDPEARFQIEVIPTGQPDRYLGIALRRDVITRLTDELADDIDHGTVECRLRAMALGLGYRAFCRADGGDLTAVADFTTEAAAICYLHQGPVVGLTHMGLKQFDLKHADDLSQMTVELKTVVNFKLAALAEDGITVPLSHIAVCGDVASDQLIGIMADTFSATVVSPTISTGFFPDRSDLSKIPLDRYLVALGLTVMAD